MSDFRDVRLADLSDAVLITKGFPTHRAAPEGDVRVMSIAALRNQSEPRHFAMYEDIQDLKIEFAQPGDVLVSIEGGTVGEAFTVEPDVEEFVPSQQVATLRVVNSEIVDPLYLGAWLSTATAQDHLERLARGTGIQRIAMKELGSLVIKIPDLETQHEIGERFIAFESAIRSHRAVATCLEELRDADLVVSFAHSSPAPSEPSPKKRAHHGR
jgi:Type I restriction modification DNA specificity domain